LQKKRNSKEGEFGNYEDEVKVLSRLIVRRKLKSLRKRIQALRFIDMKGIYKQLFADPMQIKTWMEGRTPEKWEEICQSSIEMLDEGKLFY